MPECPPGLTPCKACGEPILFAMDEKGAMHPLDPTPATYVAIEDPKKKGVFRALRSMAYVSHRATCPAAGQMRKRTAKDTEGQLL